jgi:hypothetical protein
LLATINGWEKDWHDFSFEPGRPIFTDGSAIHLMFPEIACSSAAAFQVDSEGNHRLAVAQNDATDPQSAIAVEALAAEIAIQRLRADPSHTEVDTELVADCQAVILALARGPSDTSYRRKFAGHFMGACKGQGPP